MRAAIVLGMTLLTVLVLDAVGVVAAIDDGLRARWVQLAEASGALRPTNSEVILVAADRDTIADWGPPPWPAARLAELLEDIEGAGPVLVAEVGHTRMFAPGAELDELLERQRLEVLLARSEGPRRSPWSAVGLEHGDIVLGEHTDTVLPEHTDIVLAEHTDIVLAEHSRMHQIARAAGLGPIGERLPVNWLVPGSRLPVVAANRIAADQNLRSSFRDRVVLLGITDPNYEMPVETPLGRLSPAEIEAHALAGLADGVVWAELPIGASYLLSAALASLLIWSFVRLRHLASASVVAGSVVGVLVVDFVCYHRGWIRLGSAHALLSVGMVGLSHWAHEAIETCAGLRRLRARVLRDAASKSTANPEPELEAPGFWDDLAELGAEYARETLAGEAASTIVERERERWQLCVRASAGLDADSHAQLACHERLDLRRAPFRTPWLTLRAGWAVDLLPAAPSFHRRKTLIIPLVDSTELLGLWLVHMHVDELREVGPEHIEVFERLGRQMGGSLARRRERVALCEQAVGARLRDHLETIVGGLRLLRDQHRWALELLEQLPVRALIATAWGEIEFVDPRLRGVLMRRYPGLFSPEMPENNLRVVLTRLTGKSIEEANRLMRKVVSEGVEIELDATPGIEDPGDDVWVLSRIRSRRNIDLPGFRPAVHEHILLMARSSAPAQTIRTRSGGFLRVLHGGSGEP